MKYFIPKKKKKKINNKDVEGESILNGQGSLPFFLFFTARSDHICFYKNLILRMLINF